jgi:hypothetical protein
MNWTVSMSLLVIFENTIGSAENFVVMSSIWHCKDIGGCREHDRQSDCEWSGSEHFSFYTRYLIEISWMILRMMVE